jgi:hypothetical protein
MDTFKSFRNTVLFGFFFLIVVVNSAQAQSPLEDLASLKNIASNYINTQSMDDKAIEINQWYGKLSNQAKVEIAKTGITAVNVVEKFSAMPPFVQNTLMQLGLSNEKAMLQYIQQISGQANQIINKTDTNAAKLLNGLLGM